MSKIIVDQIAKNGGATLTIPAADGSANQPVVTDGAGNLSFAPNKMPTADGTANKPVVTDGSGQLSFSPVPMPTSMGTAGQYQTVQSDGSMAFVDVPEASEWITVYDHAEDGNTSYIDYTTTTPAADLKGFDIRFTGLRTGTNSKVYVYPLNSSGSTIDTGTSHSSFYGMYSNASQTGDTNNNSYIYMSNYDVYGSSTYSMGATGYMTIGYDKEQHNGRKWNALWDMTFKRSSGYNDHVRYYGSMEPYNTSNNLSADLGGFRFSFQGHTIERGFLEVREIK